jgi:hypothetical protein
MERRPRSRLVYFVCITAVLCLGLLWHSQIIPMPSMMRKYGGDGLWALLVFFGVGFILPRASTRNVALLASCFAASIEISQLYHSPWIDSVRETIPGSLILGSVFNWPDFIAYAGGIGAGMLLEIGFELRGPRVKAHGNER